MGEKELRLETLQSKVSELKKISQSQDTPTKLQVTIILFVYLHSLRCVFTTTSTCLPPQSLQVLENDLRKKISSVQKLHEQATGNLMDFSSQKKQLEDYISQMSAWLKSMEDSLVSLPAGSDPEEICRVKVPLRVPYEK